MEDIDRFHNINVMKKQAAFQKDIQNIIIKSHTSEGPP